MTTTNNPMTPEAIVRVIAERDDIHGHIIWSTSCKCWMIQPNGSKAYFPLQKDYLSSRDALFPVIGKLSNPERFWLHETLQRLWMKDYEAGKALDYTSWLLTLPPETLAPLVARAIVESKAI